MTQEALAKHVDLNLKHYSAGSGTIHGIVVARRLMATKLDDIRYGIGVVLTCRNGFGQRMKYAGPTTPSAGQRSTDDMSIVQK